MLDGDPGHFQYISAALGIPYPPGFPLYVLLGHLWSLLPIGTLAYRMNLLSAFFGALTIGALFLVLRRQKLHVVAAFGAAVTLALIPPFWQYSTFAAEYTLHSFLTILLFGLLAEWETTRRAIWLALAMLTFGFGLSNHPTFLLFAPATGIFVIVVGGRALLSQPRFYFSSVALVALPCLLYSYFPLRANQLLNESPVAVAQGIVSQFYVNTPTGLLQYLTGMAFVKGIAGQWKWDTLLNDWGTAILQAVNLPILFGALLGAAWFAKRRVKLFVWLVVVVLTFGLVTLQYVYAALANVSDIAPYLSKFFLPGFIALIVLAAWGLDGIARARPRPLAFVAPIIALAVLVPIWGDLSSRHSSEWVERSAEVEAKWRSVQQFPPEQGAALVGHWGDLTPLWYLQTGEGWRRDLVAIFPPTDDAVNAWLANGKPLYLAGSLLEWAPGIAQRYHLTPWGSLVRVTAQDLAPLSPLAHPSETTFADGEPRLTLLGYETSRDTARVGEGYDIALYWQPVAPIALEDYVVSFTLGEARQNFPIAVNWLPGGKLATGQRTLGTYRMIVPWGMRASTYPLRVGVYSLREEKELGQSLEIGMVRVEPAITYPETVKTEHPANVDFEHRTTLLGWNGDIKEQTVGNSASLEFFWKAASAATGNLVADLSLENSQIARRVSDQALSSEQWRTGEIVRSVQSFTVPADLPEGDYALVLRVRDIANSPRTRFDGWFPRGESLTLTQVRVVGRPHSYAVPQIAHPQAANFGNQIELLGYALDPPLRLTLYWCALKAMSESYTVFVHVTDAQGHILAQKDSVPGGGTLPTTGWFANEVITDSFDFTLPQGAYEIRLGFYNAATGQRIGVVSSNQDYVVLK